MSLKLVITAIAAATAFSANATTTNWDDHAKLEVGVSLVSPGSFTDTFLFNLAEDGVVASAAVANNLEGLLKLENGTVSLYKEAGDVDTLIGSFSFDGKSGDNTHSFGALDLGSYYYSVTGNATGQLGAYYTLTSKVAPVPEPASLALLSSGVLAVGLMYRRRTPR